MEIADKLKKHIHFLAQDIVCRDYQNLDNLNAARDYIEITLERLNFVPRRQNYEIDGQNFSNVYVEIPYDKENDAPLVIGAHYDTVAGTPGADDNGSAVAALLEIARFLSEKPPDLPLILVFFTLEEPPFFGSTSMGSYRFAARLRNQQRQIRGMICLEMIGYFQDQEHSQRYPIPGMGLIYPNTGNFIAVVGNLASQALTNSLSGLMRDANTIPVQSVSALSIIPGLDFSDHSSFWKHDYQACMVTDTAFYRNPHYHQSSDLPQTLDYSRMAGVVKALLYAVYKF